MVRADANSGGSHHHQGGEQHHHFQPGETHHQTPEIIDDSPHDPPLKNPEKPHKYQTAADYGQPAVGFPPQNSQPNTAFQQHPAQFPPPFHHDQPPPQAFPPHHGGGQPPQPQAFPPPQAEVNSFPPPNQHQNMHYPYQNPLNFQNPGAGQNPPLHPGMQKSPYVQFPSNPPAVASPVPQGFPVAQNTLPTQPWQTDLFGCMEDPTNAIITACFPCVTFGQIAEIIDSGTTSCGTSGMLYGCIAFLIGMPCLISCTYRTKLRARYGLMETPGPDWLVHCLCEWCALCQEYRELQRRGLDPSIGWLGNVGKAQQMAAMTPPVAPRMMA